MIEENDIVKILKETFTTYWDRPALTDYSTKITYTHKAICEKIAKLHILMHKCAMDGDVKIAVMGKNSSHWAITYMAILTNGSIVVPILEDFNPLDVEHILNHSETDMLFCDVAAWKNIKPENLKRLKYVVSLEDFEFLYSSTAINNSDEEFEQLYPNGVTKENLNFRSRDVDVISSLNYTSGTTSMTKGVMLSSKNIARNVTYLKREFEPRGIKMNRTVCVLPMAHAYGLAFGFLGSMIYGMEITFLGKAPSPNLMTEVCKSVHPDLLVLVPLVFEKIYKYNIAPLYENKFIKLIHEVGFMDKILHKFIVRKIEKSLGGSLQEVVIGGAEFNSHIEKFLHKGKFPFCVGYGMTECAPLISYVRHEDFVMKSVGKIVIGDFLKIRITKKKESDQAGEIQVKGDSVMLGYYKDPEATAATFTSDGWLKTGDKGMIDEEGNIFIKGRYKTMLLGPSGENIYPESIETKLSSLPLVGECIIVQNDKFKLEAYVYPDYQRMKTGRINDTHMREIMEKNRLKLNRITSKFENIATINILDNPLPKTPKNTIKRYGLEKYLTKSS